MSTPTTAPGWIYYQRRRPRGRAAHGWVADRLITGPPTGRKQSCASHSSPSA
jgi:hypothetical protein